MSSEPVVISLEPLRRPGGTKELAAALVEAHDKPVTLDASPLDDIIPALGLQTILCAQKDWETRELAFAVTNLHDNCRNSLVLLGLQEDHFNAGDPS